MRTQTLDVTLSVNDTLIVQLDSRTTDEVLRELAGMSLDRVDIETRATLAILLGLNGEERAVDVADRLGVSTAALLDAVTRTGLRGAVRLSRSGRTMNVHLTM